MSSLHRTLHGAVRVSAAAESHLLKPDHQLDNALSNSLAQGLPPITISKLQGQFLSLLCQLTGVKSILEIGTLGGYSSIWFAKTGAKVTSIEINSKHRDVALENVKGLDVEIILGAALDVLPALAKEGRKFDLVFIDADWTQQLAYFDWAVKLTRQGGCVYVDNVVRQLLEEEQDGTGSDSLVAGVGKDERVDATMIPTFGYYKSDDEERFDGFLLARVK